MWARFSELLAINHRLTRMEDSLCAIERKMDNMATRADFDALKAELKADVDAIVQKVSDLEAKIAAGNPITDQDVADLKVLITELTGGTPAPPPPTP